MNQIAIVKEKYDHFQRQLSNSEVVQRFEKALPSHINKQKFEDVVLTVVRFSPGLLDMDRKSLLDACVRAAADGLLPDGRQAALVPYKGKVQYIPMVEGLRLKIHRSGAVQSVKTAVVYRQEIESGDFYYEAGLEPILRHKPCLDLNFNPNDKDIAAAYSIVVFKDGSKDFLVQPRHKLMKVKNSSAAQSANAPWATHFAEMCEKTVQKRHLRLCPQLSDITIDDADDYTDFSEADAIAGDNDETPILPSAEQLAEQSPEPDEATDAEFEEDASEPSLADEYGFHKVATAEATPPADLDIDALEADITDKLNAAQTVEALTEGWKQMADDINQLKQFSPAGYDRVAAVGAKRKAEIAGEVGQ